MSRREAVDASESVLSVLGVSVDRFGLEWIARLGREELEVGRVWRGRLVDSCDRVRDRLGLPEDENGSAGASSGEYSASGSAANAAGCVICSER